MANIDKSYIGLGKNNGKVTVLMSIVFENFLSNSHYRIVCTLYYKCKALDVYFKQLKKETYHRNIHVHVVTPFHPKYHAKRTGALDSFDCQLPLPGGRPDKQSRLRPKISKALRNFASKAPSCGSCFTCRSCLHFVTSLFRYLLKLMLFDVC